MMVKQINRTSIILKDFAIKFTQFSEFVKSQKSLLKIVIEFVTISNKFDVHTNTQPNQMENALFRNHRIPYRDREHWPRSIWMFKNASVELSCYYSHSLPSIWNWPWMISYYTRINRMMKWQPCDFTSYRFHLQRFIWLQM